MTFSSPFDSQCLQLVFQVYLVICRGTEVDWPVVPQILLLAFLEDRSKAYLLPALRNLHPIVTTFQ